MICDPQKRQLYDTYGHAGLEGYSQEDIFRNADLSSLFRDFGLGSIFGDMFGRSGGGSPKGADLRYDLTVTLEEVAFGTEKQIKMQRSEKCMGL